MSPKESANKRPSNPRAPSQAKDRWQFVNFNGHKETQSAQIRRVIRVNAARTHWRRQRELDLQSHREGTSSFDRDDSGRAQASFARLVHRNSTKASNNQEMPHLPTDMQAVSDELEPPGLTSGPVHNKCAVHAESQQGEHAGTELQTSLAAMQVSTVPSPPTFGGGVIDVRVSGLLIAALVLFFGA